MPPSTEDPVVAKVMRRKRLQEDHPDHSGHEPVHSEDAPQNTESLQISLYARDIHPHRRLLVRTINRLRGCKLRPALRAEMNSFSN